MDPIKVFIDTEFTNFFVPALISIGLVADTGEETYFEVDYEYADCSDFVRETVIPLLSSGPYMKFKKDDLHKALYSWFQIIKSPGQTVEICYDAEIDWLLFSQLFDMHLASWIVPLNIEYQVSTLLQYDYYKKNLIPEHHALNDARAIAFAYRKHIP